MLRNTGLVALALVVVSCAGDPGASSDVGSDPDPKTGSSSGSTSSSSGSTPTDGNDAGTTPSTAVPVRFVAMGDAGTGSSDQQKVGNTIAAVCKARGCDFVQLLGDNLYQSGASSIDDPIWQTHFETPYAAVDLPFWVVLGNHDYGGDGLGNEFDKGKNEIDYTTKSTKWKLPSAYWHQTWGSGALEVFGLDTNMIFWNKADDQKGDVPKWFAASTAEWKIAMGHHPYLSNGKHGNAGNYDAIGGVIPIPAPANGKHVKSFLEDHVCGKVDVYLSGHDHSRQWLNESCKGTELAVSGAGAKTTELGGKNAVLFESLELGFLYIVIDGKTLTAEFIDENGNTEFTHKITKP